MRDLLFWNVMQRGLIVTDVAGQPISPIFKRQAVKKGVDSLTLEDGTDRLFRNFDNYLPNYAE